MSLKFFKMYPTRGAGIIIYNHLLNNPDITLSRKDIDKLVGKHVGCSSYNNPYYGHGGWFNWLERVDYNEYALRKNPLTIERPEDYSMPIFNY